MHEDRRPGLSPASKIAGLGKHHELFLNNEVCFYFAGKPMSGLIRRPISHPSQPSKNSVRKWTTLEHPRLPHFCLLKNFVASSSRSTVGNIYRCPRSSFLFRAVFFGQKMKTLFGNVQLLLDRHRVSSDAIIHATKGFHFEQVMNEEIVRNNYSANIKLSPSIGRATPDSDMLILLFVRILFFFSKTRMSQSQVAKAEQMPF